MKLTQEYTIDIEGRFKYGTIFVVVLIAIVIARLYYLQVDKVAPIIISFSTQNNSIKEITIPAARGMIFDRRGQVLVDNRPSFDVVVIPQYVADPERMFSPLSALLNMPQRSSITLLNATRSLNISLWSLTGCDAGRSSSYTLKKESMVR